MGGIGRIGMRRTTHHWEWKGGGTEGEEGKKTPYNEMMMMSIIIIQSRSILTILIGS